MTTNDVSALLAKELHEVAEWLLSSRLSGHEHVAISAAGSVKRAADFLASRHPQPVNEPCEWEVEATELKMTPIDDGLPVRDELRGEQTILTYNDRVGTWDIAFMEAGWDDFDAGFALGVTHWLDISSMWPGVIAQVLSFRTPPAPERSKEETGVKVRPLEWEHGDDESDPNWRLADTIVGRYQIVRGILTFTGISYEQLVETTLAKTGDFESIAQADYEQRLLSVLETPPLHKEGDHIADAGKMVEPWAWTKFKPDEDLPPFGLVEVRWRDSEPGKPGEINDAAAIGWQYVAWWRYAEPQPTPVAPVPVTITPEMVGRVLVWVREDVLPAYGITHSTRASDPEMIEGLTAALSAKPTGEE